MHAIMLEKEEKAERLWKTLAAISAIFLLRLPKRAPVIDPDISRQIRHTLDHQKISWKLARKLKLAILPHDHPLKIIASEMGARAGVHIHSVFLDPAAPHFYNASIRNDGRNNAAITFYGNPLLEKDGDILCRAVTGHEIAHAALDYTGYNRGQFEEATYDLSFRCLMLSSAVAVAFPLWPAGLPVLSAAIATAGLVGPAALRQAFRRNNEYMADLKGAEISGNAAGAVQDLQYLAHLKTEKKSLHPELRRSKLQCLSDLFIDSTHPPMEKRIAALCTAFNLQSPPPEEEQAAPERPQDSFRRSIACEQIFWL
jgi:hypothetical protein